tara:strand:- start:5 stop:307 length:303 start_codon:yes stop_codon:yes gene_type:complete
MDKDKDKARAVNLRDEDYDVYIGRGGHNGYFGNPFVLGRDGNREQVIKKYEEWFERKLKEDKEFKARILELNGQRLGCFCKPYACHGDVIAEYVNNYLPF